MNFMESEDLEKAILIEKEKGTPDVEIGRKYGVSFKFIERVITKTQGVNVSILKNSCKKIKTFSPKNFKEERTTLWSFKQRGNWATHSGEYRGNWSPYIPRNVILKYSKPGEIVLDYFCGAGTTAVECKLLGRRCIGIDINEKAIELAKKNLLFTINQKCLCDESEQCEIYEPELFVRDARDLSFLKDNSIDLICTHPPYANVIHYTNSKEGDLSFLEVEDFLIEMSKIAEESFRVLKQGRQCAILIGDLRKKKYVIPLGFKLIDVYLKAGFKLRELVIKRQHNCRTTGFWYENSMKYNFLLLAHEYLLIFEKPIFRQSIKEQDGEYGIIIPTSEEIRTERKLDRFEATTVWVFPERDFEEKVSSNVIGRYSKNRKYEIISFVSGRDFTKITEGYNWQKGKDLLFIKAPFLKDNATISVIENYLQRIKEIVNDGLTFLENYGFLIIQTRDIRINGYVEPLGKKIVDILSDYINLYLKEIVVVAPEDVNLTEQDSKEYLEIVHQYLLIYEVKR